MKKTNIITLAIVDPLGCITGKCELELPEEFFFLKENKSNEELSKYNRYILQLGDKEHLITCKGDWIDQNNESFENVKKVVAKKIGYRNSPPPLPPKDRLFAEGQKPPSPPETTNQVLHPNWIEQRLSGDNLYSEGFPVAFIRLSNGTVFAKNSENTYEIKDKSIPNCMSYKYSKERLMIREFLPVFRKDEITMYSDFYSGGAGKNSDFVDVCPKCGMNWYNCVCSHED